MQIQAQFTQSLLERSFLLQNLTINNANFGHDDIRSGTKANSVTGGGRISGLILLVPVACSQCKINKCM